MPTFRHGKNTTVLSDDFDLTTYLNSATAAYSVDVPETTTFGSSDRSYIVGHNEGTLSFEGLFDGTTDSADSIFHAALGNATDKVITVSNDSTAIGGRAILAAAASTSYEISSPLTDVVSVSAEAIADGGLDSGIWLVCQTAVSTTTNTSSVDNAASSTNGGVAHMHVTANARSATTVIAVQHSADNSTWADLVVFGTVALSGKDSERVEVAAGTTVNRYLRTRTTIATGTGAITRSVAFSRR
jgi:hypothetical protein